MRQGARLDRLASWEHLQLHTDNFLYIFEGDENVFGLQIRMDQLALGMEVVHAKQDLFGNAFDQSRRNSEIDQGCKGRGGLPAGWREVAPVLFGKCGGGEFILFHASLRKGEQILAERLERHTNVRLPMQTGMLERIEERNDVLVAWMGGICGLDGAEELNLI